MRSNTTLVVTLITILVATPSHGNTHLERFKWLEACTPDGLQANTGKELGFNLELRANGEVMPICYLPPNDSTPIHSLLWWKDTEPRLAHPGTYQEVWSLWKAWEEMAPKDRKIPGLYLK